MSRIGDLPISIPEKVEVSIKGKDVVVKGPLGQSDFTFLPGVDVKNKDGVLVVTRENDSLRAVHGMTRAILNNMVIGVSTGWSKTLQFIGTGFNAKMQGKWLRCNLGFSHEVIVEVPAHLKAEAKAPEGKQALPVNVQVTISGINKEEVGKFADQIRKIKPPENYKGKGIRYQDEFVKIKQGKKAE